MPSMISFADSAMVFLKGGDEGFSIMLFSAELSLQPFYNRGDL
jgi:hypothetical protein